MKLCSKLLIKSGRCNYKMNYSMNISKNGVKAQQKALDITSNNIANVSTQGFKARTINFRSLIKNDLTADTSLLTNDFGMSAGVKSQEGDLSMHQGTLRSSNQAIDLALTDEGFFGVQNSAGDFYLSRDGSFMLDHMGQVVNSNGDYLVVNEQVPFTIENSEFFSIDSSGNILNKEGANLGQISVYLPDNNRSLEALGNNYFKAPEEGLTLLNDINNIEVNQLEQSNVDLSKEFTDMIIAQRAYDLNIRVTQASDEIKMMTNQFS